MIQQFATLFEMMQVFGDEQKCVDHLRAIRWAEGAYCPYCEATACTHLGASTPPRWRGTGRARA